ncbi:MAG: hypothetical protein EBR82_81320 [Caulobacteraceae bacterium]|nr:hypothetical protein [Caulobacteraceae bacterium]
METQLATTNTGVAQHIRQATDVAGACREIVKATAQRIGNKDYVKVEGWQSIAVAHGCVASAKDVERVEGGWKCIGEVRRMDNGQVISTAEGFLGDDEDMWAKRPTYARRAMCQTRAISRACRSAFAHVVVLIDRNLSTTPAEEVPMGGFDEPRQLNTDKYEAPSNEEIKEITAQLVEEKKSPDSQIKDMVIGFGKYKGKSVREIARHSEGFSWLMWLSEQPLKNAPDGQPYRKDVQLRAVVKAVIEEGEKDEIPF